MRTERKADKMAEEIMHELSDIAGDELSNEDARFVSERLFRYTISTPTTEETALLATKLSIQWDLEMNGFGKAKQIMEKGTMIVGNPSVAERMGSLFTGIHAQIRLFSLSFWLSSAFLAVLGAWLGAYSTSEDLQPLIFTAPLLAAIGLFLAFRSYGTPMYELEMTFPISPMQAVFGRLILLIVYDTVITFAASLLFPEAWGAASLAKFTFSWLVPLGITCFLTLAVMLSFGLAAGSAASIGLWTLQLLLNRNLGPFYLYSDVDYVYWWESKMIGLMFLLAAFLFVLCKLKLNHISERVIR
jgi:hypothetical protein